MREKLSKLLSREKLKNTLHTILEFLFNPPLLICLGIAWLITNGWSYIVFTLGVYFDVPLMIGIASAYITAEACAQGLSTCILGWLDDAKIREICGLEGAVRLVITIGYAKEGDKLREKKRKALSELVTEI